ncbi:hypothetical protein LJC45_03460 [Alistipes sp. OttesenSCG-928-B03]|nr:hypothetical protein [Alistipes sp. OttesenSCG-928-B03]
MIDYDLNSKLSTFIRTALSAAGGVSSSTYVQCGGEISEPDLSRFCVDVQVE